MKRQRNSSKPETSASSSIPQTSLQKGKATTQYFKARDLTWANDAADVIADRLGQVDGLDIHRRIQGYKQQARTFTRVFYQLKAKRC